MTVDKEDIDSAVLVSHGRYISCCRPSLSLIDL